ncbi:MAG: hypothetical protein AAF414_21145 [Pseudomonadota bacterium]
MSLRIRGPAANQSQQVAAQAQADGQTATVDTYLDRLVKLVPVEAIAAYPLLEPLAEPVGHWAVVLLSWVLLAVVVGLRWHATSQDAPGPQRVAVFVAGISFVIWVYVLDGHFGVCTYLVALGATDSCQTIEEAREFLSTLALVAWTILVPLFYEGDAG